MMQLAIRIVLGILLLGAFYRLFLWRAAPGEGNLIGTRPALLETRLGKALIGLILLLFALILAEHLMETQKPPAQHYEPPHMENGRIVPSRIY